MNFWIEAALIGAATGVGLGISTGLQARVRPVEAGPQYLKDMRSIGDVISSSGSSEVHIFYVHGMRADASGASQPLIKTLLKSDLLKDARESPSKYEPLPVGDRPAAATYAGTPIWSCLPNDEHCNLSGREEVSWARSQPFTRTTRIEGAGRTVVVTEVNWWPLLMALKCRFLTAPDSLLSGPHKKQLLRCSTNQEGDDEHDPYFDWISRSEAHRIVKRGALAGSAAKANGWVKRNIFNWGLADAVITLGPMRQFVRAAIDKAAAKAPPTATQIVVTESLGSFVVMDASREQNVRSLIQKTRDFYFLANQFALLELARIEGLEGDPDQASKSIAGVEGAADQESKLADETAISPLRSFQEVILSSSQLAAPRPAQIVAVSDPSDMLSWHVPAFCDIDVANLYWRFSGGPLNLLANPLKAHTGGVTSERLWKLLLKTTGNNEDAPQAPCPAAAR